MDSYNEESEAELKSDAKDVLNVCSTGKNQVKVQCDLCLSSSVSDDVNVKPRSCGKKIRTPYKLQLKSRKPSIQQQRSKLKSTLKGASIHASKQNSISSSQQV